MKFQFLMIVLITISSLFSFAKENVMPPKNPKAQTTEPPVAHPSGNYGDANFDEKKAQPMSLKMVDGDIIIKTLVSEVCPKKGCWMKVKNAKDTQDVRVTFKDYGFFVPTDLVGKEIALKGRYVKHVESVEEQKHLLKDAKRPQVEIDAITTPKETVRFIATGIKDLSVQPKN